MSEKRLKSKEKFIFYYDEAEHSRKITKNTITASNYAAYFVASCIGTTESFLDEFNKRYIDFENKYTERFSKGELKSLTMSGYFKYGFASLTKNNYKFMLDLLSLFDDNIYLYFSVLNKFEYIILQITKEYSETPLLSYKNFVYSLTKMITTYKPKNVIDSIYENDGNFIKETKSFLKQRLLLNREIANIKLKELENASIEQLLIILDDYNKQYTIDWDYSIAFYGFSLYIKETGIKEYKLILDKEGEARKDSNTMKAAKLEGLKNVSETKSTECFGVRAADMLVGIISQFIKSIDYDFQYKNDDDYKTKQYLDEKWFSINDEKLELYKKMKEIICVNNNAWYKTFSGIYSDSFVIFIAILNYFSKFNSSAEFNKIKIEDHKERMNSIYLSSIMDLNKRNGLNLPLEIVPVDDNDFYYDRFGVKYYHDFKRHPYLEIPIVKNIKEKGKIYDVLSVGFFGKMEQASIKINENGKGKIYLLPNELLGWALDAVAMSNMNMNAFPSEVEFGLLDGRYYAEVL